MSVDIQVLKNAIHRLKQKKKIRVQLDIARDTGYKPATISEILNERQNLSYKFVQAFAKAYDLNPETLEESGIRLKESDQALAPESMTQGLYAALLEQMNKTNEISLMLAESLKARDKEALLNVDTINKNALIITRLSEVFKEVAGENKLKKALGKVS